MPAIAPVNIPANKLVTSPTTTLSANINTATVQLTDSSGSTTPAANSNWLTTTGNITQWGVQVSANNGATWSWLVGPVSDVFGAVDRSGGMPQQSVSSTIIQANAGNLVRLAIQTDTTIKLGAVITVS